MPFITSWSSVPFQKTPAGLKEKRVEEGGHVMRLVEFPPNWRESETCRKGHVAYVVTGTMELRIKGQNMRLKPGDAVTIPEGEPHLSVTGTQSCLVLIFEARGEAPSAPKTSALSDAAEEGDDAWEGGDPSSSNDPVPR